MRVQLTALDKPGVLLDMGRPAIRVHTLVPEAFDGSALQEADDDSSDIDDELGADDAPEKVFTAGTWRNDAEKQEGNRYPAEPRAHDGKELAEVHPLHGVHGTLRLILKG